MQRVRKNEASTQNFAQPTSTKMDALLKWIQTPEATKIATATKAKAWIPFLAKYPKADKSKFIAQANFAADHTATAEIYYKAGPCYLVNVFNSDSKYWSTDMKNALGQVHHEYTEGFPEQLSPSGLKRNVFTNSRSWFSRRRAQFEENI